ncbi:orotate phosphoribosyltransferase [Methanocorpusculum labreanum Z]|uniref:Orotate phosphoribosyltransferase n=1 Tax=Methanocorpusculum labreanum (strain ATCC 43576 / DSM 4855 / Z) TaxID=410358 RepID=PYRE_METLZ|nr:orotate phosphoribosyltransferase [Methanocorpusculum labreanum]A2SQ87.1 RecName: Full=Orotate phosphoribosyltransferase; Short=OPRT; Short=OPRTase [Methanocorpusculum labreanum Z]ABN06493.1 orotate phosphoribosyltransferase [Methanocorpusculum labreanum Z]
MVNRILDLLIQYKAVEFGDFTLASGAQSKYYIDVKTAIMQPELLSEIAAEVAKKYDFECIAGVAVGGVPLAVAVSLAANKPCAVIRAAAKDHGKSQMIIGNVKGQRVLLIEDVTTSGGSSKYGVEELRKAGALIDSVVTVVDREGGAEELLAAEGITLHPLVKASELLA